MTGVQTCALPILIFISKKITWDEKLTTTYIWKTNCFRSKKLDFQINNCSKSIFSSCKKRTSLLAKNNKISLIIYLHIQKAYPHAAIFIFSSSRAQATADVWPQVPKKGNRERERSRFALRFIQWSTPCSQNCLHLNTGREIAENSDFITLSRNWNLMIVHVTYLVNFQKLLWWLQRVGVCGHGLVCLFSEYPWTQRSTQRVGKTDCFFLDGSLVLRC